jgi:hypothetical protein
LSSRRGNRRIVELCNFCHNAEDGRKDKQAGMFFDRNRLSCNGTVSALPTPTQGRGPGNYGLRVPRISPEGLEGDLNGYGRYTVGLLSRTAILPKQYYCAIGRHKPSHTGLPGWTHLAPRSDGRTFRQTTRMHAR